ncbi:MAG: undecaprenyldiphospho-muramoylpentapeptide beta-N-acetylglucosaminyltransferase [Balneolaceae bacterium]
MMTYAAHISPSKAAEDTRPLRFLLAAGGTGGHVYPAISIADALLSELPDAKILFVGTRDRMEWETVPKAGYEIKSIWISGFHRRLTPQNLLFPLKLVVSLIQSLAILIRFRPDAVISCGGFASGPIGWVAARMGIPLFLQEQNSYPGVTNRMLAAHAQTIFTAFDEAANHLPKEKIERTGNPIRNQITDMPREEAAAHFSFDASAPTLLILGGSGGARAINDALRDTLDTLHNELGLQLLWQCGPGYLDGLLAAIDVSRYPNLRLTGYIDTMAAAYGTADLVLTRAGAGTCSELLAAGKASILVPSPNVAGDHQAKNADAMEQGGASLRIAETELAAALPQQLRELLNNPDTIRQMEHRARAMARPDASATIAKRILTVLETNRTNE